jgi:uncharacterized protein YukE
MADVFLQPQDVENAEQQLSQAENEMMDSIDNTNRALQQAADALSGATTTAWLDFQNQVNQQHDHLVADFQQGITALGQMRDLLVEADNNGAKRFAL